MITVPVGDRLIGEEQPCFLLRDWDQPQRQRKISKKMIEEAAAGADSVKFRELLYGRFYSIIHWFEYVSQGVLLLIWKLLELAFGRISKNIVKAWNMHASKSSDYR